MKVLLKLKIHSYPASLFLIIKVYKAKVTLVFLSQADIWGFNKISLIEQTQSKHLRSIMKGHKRTSAAALRDELGI